MLWHSVWRKSSKTHKNNARIKIDFFCMLQNQFQLFRIVKPHSFDLPLRSLDQLAVWNPVLFRTVFGILMPSKARSAHDAACI